MPVNVMVGITTFRRPEYLAEVRQSWSRVAGIEEIDWKFRVEPGHEGVEAICRDWQVGRSQEIVVNDRVRGPLTNPWLVLEDCFGSGAEFTIVAEDDAVVAPDVLRFMRWSAETFADSDVVAVCAFQRKPWPGAEPGDVGFEDRFAPTIWGTWGDRWDSLLRDTWDHDYSSGRGLHGGWDWNINLRLRQGRPCVFPRISRSSHIGKYGGAHMVPEQFDASVAEMVKSYDGEYRLCE